MSSSISVLRHRLASRALHIDFVRLRCGGERTFAQGVWNVRSQIKKTDQQPHVFVAFSEWDGVVLLPSSELYPRTLTNLYADEAIVSSISGTSGYFCYLWDHPVNRNWIGKLAGFESSGVTTLM